MESQAIVVATAQRETQEDTIRGLSAWPGEPVEAWRAFQAFRDQKPPRRVLGVVGAPTATLSGWARDFDWYGRTKAYDSYMESIVQAEKEAAFRLQTREIVSEHLALLQTARQLVQRELDKLLATSKESDLPIARISEIAKLMEMEIKYSRLLDNKSTENVAAQVNLNGLSVEELKQLRALRQKIT